MDIGSQIFHAAQIGNLDQLTYILNNYHDKAQVAVNSCYEYSDSFVTSPLGIAAKNGHLISVKFLRTSYLARVDLEEEGYHSPLWCAVSENHSNIVQYLLMEGANVNARVGSNRETALNAACFKGHIDIVKYLVEKYNADPKMATLRDNNTCLMIAAHRGFVDIVEYLVDKVDVNTQNLRGISALHHAAESGSVKVVEILLNHGAEVNVTDYFGNTPLWHAILDNSTRIINLLQQKVDNKTLINADELIGAILVENRQYVNARLMWRRALMKREKYKIYKENIHRSSPLMEAFDYKKVEFNSIPELDNMTSTIDQIIIQAALIRERILTSMNTRNSFYMKHLSQQFYKENKWSMSLQFLMCHLSMELNLECSSYWTFDALSSLNNQLCEMIRNNSKYLKYLPLVYSITLKYIKTNLNYYRFYEPMPLSPAKSDNFESSLIMLLRLLVIIIDNKAIINKYLLMKKQVQNMVLEYQPVVTFDNKYTLLHLACLKINPPNVKLVKFLRNIGVDPTLPDNEGKTPWDVVIDRDNNVDEEFSNALLLLAPNK